MVDATPILPGAMPHHPAVARSAELGRVTVSARITIDTAGCVTDVAPRLVNFSGPNEFSREFEAAAATALAHWRFTPAEIHRLEDAPRNDGGTYMRLSSREKIEAACDVVFTFTETGAGWTGPPAR